MFSIVTTPLIILTIEHILHLLKWFQNRFFHCVYICWINNSPNLPSHCLGIKANCITFYLFLLWVFTNLWPITSSSLQISIPGPLLHAPITPCHVLWSFQGFICLKYWTFSPPLIWSSNVSQLLTFKAIPWTSAWSLATTAP